MHAYLEGKTLVRESLAREHHGPRAVLNALNRLAGEYDKRCVTAQRELTVVEHQLRDYQARLDKPFAHEDYMRQLSGLRDQLKRSLSGAPVPEG